jgi:NodT family efflux transporter outer membrane factor (OMF) lipoprotein
VGPDYHPPTVPKDAGYAPQKLPDKTSGGEAQRYVQDLDIPGQWWTLFHSPQLNALIERALKANPDLVGAEAALRNAVETLKAQQATLLPTIQGSYSPSRQKNATGTIAPTLTNNQPIYTLHTTQLTLDYTLDVFGGTRREIESLAATAEQQRFQGEATYLTLISNLVAAAVTEASIRAQIEATQQQIAIEQSLTDLVRRERTLGQLAEADVVAQEALLAQTQAQLPSLTKQLDIQRDLITALCGSLPNDAPDEKIEFATLSLPTDLPVSLPSKLLEQRPDIKAAAENLHSATAQVGVAIANQLPNFTLSASLGTTATDLAKLFSPGNGFWSLVGNADQTIFDGGSLLHKRRAADAALDQAAAQYRSTVVSAFQNVADTLHSIQADADTLAADVATERAAERSLSLARAQAGLGDTGQLAVLAAELSYQQAVNARVQALAARYADTAALFQALGGGWWNRTELDAAK